MKKTTEKTITDEEIQAEIDKRVQEALKAKEVKTSDDIGDNNKNTGSKGLYASSDGIDDFVNKYRSLVDEF